MTTVKYLEQAKRFEFMIQNKSNEVERFKAMATSITVAPKEDVIQSSGDKDKIGTLMAKVIDLENEVRVLTESRDKIIKQIESISDADMYQIMYLKYIEDLSFSEIGRMIHYQKSSVVNKLKNALVIFEEKYGSQYLDIV